MASLEEFESTLKEVVQAKRLSASKIDKLTEIMLKTVENDTQLVSILYRSHKSLPPEAKVSSLYVFDALSRAARRQVTKHGLTRNVNADKGNCATFLLKIEGILEGLFQDMIKTGSPEAKEKTKKILDIWIKGETFPPKILTLLSDVVEGKSKVPENLPVPTSDPRITPLASQTPSLLATDPQATLLALLAQAKAVTPSLGQSYTNNGAILPTQVDAAQLTLLRQLAQSVTTGPNITPASSAPLTPAFAPQYGSRSPPSSSTTHDPRHDVYHAPDHSSRFPVHHRGQSRGDSRGGFRGRRGDGRRWEDRERYDRRLERDNDWNGGRSRSRSPPSRTGARRDIRPYSPPRRPSISTVAHGNHSGPPQMTAHQLDKDEFGRDIRPDSPEVQAQSLTKVPKSPEPPIPPVDTPARDSSDSLQTNHESMSLSPVAGNTSSSTISPTGMEKFDLTTFDFTSASSWEALGKMWQVTYRYEPTAEQLMQFVMSGGQMTAASGSEEWPAWGASNSAPSWRGGRGRGGFQGSGGESRHGNVRTPYTNRWDADKGNQATEAVILGGGAEEEDMDVEGREGGQDSHHVGEPGGRMERVGDKWMFVRKSTTSGS